MIKITNNGKTVEITDNNNANNEDYTSIRPKKSITLKPKEKFCINTGLTIECSSDADECWVYSDPIFDPKENELEGSDNIGILTHRITKENGAYKLMFIGGYMGEEELTIPKGCEIARIYTSIRNPRQVDADEIFYNTLYQNENIIVKSSPKFFARYETVTEADGYSYLKVDLS